MKKTSARQGPEDGWIGVDLDGTLAHYDTWPGPGIIGEPVPRMLGRVRAWLKQGREVRIMTARAGDPEEVVAIQAWLEIKCQLPRLPVTNVKDYKMLELWDDRAVQVKKNTGMVIGYSSRGLE